VPWKLDGFVTGALIPQKYCDQSEESTDDNQSLVVDPSCQTTHIQTIPVEARREVHAEMYYCSTTLGQFS
jgi:hypothetical protein